MAVRTGDSTNFQWPALHGEEIRLEGHRIHDVLDGGLGESVWVGHWEPGNTSPGPQLSNFLARL